ncbi:MAG: amidohydrolase [Flavobacteriia bacterium]|nr:amidohydrolase [Flavobacteriia bacterium]
MTKSYINTILDEADFLHEKIVLYRRHLHQYPELSFQEKETSTYVFNTLKNIGIEQVSFLCDTGVVAYIPSKERDNKTCIAFRADLDALPIEEQNELSYKSKNHGVMHACGHDAHTAILLGFAELAWKHRGKLKKGIKIIFQPGEERNPGGASLLIAEGVLENPKVEKIYALHVYPDLKTGSFGYKSGKYMASSDEIYIKVYGKGGHGALPHLCVDTVLIASQLIVQLQQLVSRFIPAQIPSVLSFGYFEAKGSTNVIPDMAEIRGTFRCMDESWRKKALEKIEEIVHQSVLSSGGKAEFYVSRGYPMLYNNDSLSSEWLNNMSQYFERENLKELDLRMTSEDFAFYSLKTPSFFFRLGVSDIKNENQYGVHHPKFNIDEKSLVFGVKAFVLCAF